MVIVAGTKIGAAVHRQGLVKRVCIELAHGKAIIVG